MKTTLRSLALFLLLSICTTAQADGWLEQTDISGSPLTPPSDFWNIPAAMAFNNTYLFATQGGTLQRSGDQGASWTLVSTGVTAVAANDEHLFMYQMYANICRSGTNGDNWTIFGQLPWISGKSNYCSALTIQGNYLFAATWGGKYYKRALYELAGVTPTAAVATNITTTAFDAGWSVSTGDLGYRLDVATDAAFTALVEGYNNKDVGNVASFNVTGLTAATTYYYRVRAVNVYGTSGNSNTVTALTSN